MDPQALGLAQPPRILRPGIRTLPLGQERYLVAGAGALVLRLAAGDRLRVIDLEGRQPCEILAFRSDGKPADGLLGRPARGSATGAKAFLSKSDSRLAKHGLSLGGAASLDLSAPTARPARKSPLPPPRMRWS